MNTQLLTQNEIKELTGSPRRDRQAKILAKHGIKFVTRTDGKISTTWIAVNSVLAHQVDNEQEEPDLEFLRQ